jgi:type VI secretion system lysozyme-like protein
MDQEAGIRLLVDNFPYSADQNINFNITGSRAITSLLKDISDLLNSKPAYPSSNDSCGYITSYGLQDLSYYSPYSKKDQTEVSNIIKDCLTKFEPRLQDITVIPVAQKNNNYSVNFCFKITATLRLPSETISLILESKIDINSKKVSLNLAS